MNLRRGVLVAAGFAAAPLLVGCSGSSGSCEDLAREQAEAEELWGAVISEHQFSHDTGEIVNDSHEVMLDARATVIAATARATEACK